MNVRHIRVLSSTLANSLAIKVDRNFSYAVFVSYAEVYNEKVCRLTGVGFPNTDTVDLRPPRQCPPDYTCW